MAKTIEELRKELDKKKQNDNSRHGQLTLPPPDGTLIGGGMGIAVISVLQDVVRDTIMKEKTMRTALMLASTVVNMSWPELDPEKFELDNYSLADFADIVDLTVGCKIFKASYTDKKGVYYVSADWNPSHSEEDHVTGAIGVDRKYATIAEDKSVTYWGYDHLGRPRKISYNEFFGMPEILFKDEKSDDYGLRQFSSMMKEKYERLRTDTYLEIRQSEQTQGTIKLLNILEKYNLEAEMCEVYVEGCIRYAASPVFVEGSFAVLYNNDTCYPVVYCDEHSDITITIFIAKSIQEVLDFWNFAARIIRRVTERGNCYPLSVNAFEIYDGNNGYTLKFRDDRTALTEHELMLSQIIHAAQKNDEHEDEDWKI